VQLIGSTMFLDKIPFFSDPEHRETTKTIFIRIVEEVTGGVVHWWRRMRAMVDGNEFIMVLGGDQHDASGEYATVLGGLQAKADLYGQVVHASGWFFNFVGSSQHALLLCRISTSDATPTDLYLDGSGERLVLKNQSAWAFKGIIVGIRVPGTQEARMWEIEGLIRRDTTAGSTTMVFNNVTLLGGDAGTTGWGTPTLAADTTNGALQIQVTGASSESIRWTALVDYVDIGSEQPV